MKQPKNFIEDENFKERRISLVGQQLEYMYIEKVAGYTPEIREGIERKIVVYEATCNCGNKLLGRAKDIKRGKIKSCGCLHKEKAKQMGFENKKEKGSSGINVIYRTYFKRAIERNLEFNLDRITFEKLILDNCYFCGTPPKNEIKLSYTGNSVNGQIKRNGIDRLDNTKGYTLENSVTCCTRCNYAKHTTDLQTFVKWSENLYLNLKQKGLIQE